MEETEQTSLSFKIPTTPEVPVSKPESVTSTESAPQAKPPNKQNLPLPYQEPEWGGIPPSGYSLEIIKNGTVVSTMDLKSSYVVFGRLDTVCDVVFQHPSVSRFHALIQYCKGDSTHPKGFYLYDLGSTHGTFLNKEGIKSKIYYKLKVGYVVKFGGSSRLHIFQGPDEPEEEQKATPSDKVPEAEGCNWGMGEDADEDEEDNLAENPFAVSTENEDLYIDDPKKTLRGWFEREGYELEYNAEEKGYRTFSCTIKLPIDTPTGEFLTVEASVNGKKKEAVVACALEACRTLDRMGLLRQSHHESRRRKKKWEDNDFYDSDEDTFYDRTGDIEKRREMRKRLQKKSKPETFETIKTKLTELNAEIDSVKTQLSAYEVKTDNGSSGKEDSLESYMSSLSSNVPTDKFQKRKLKLRLIEAEKEKAHLEKLANIAKPASLPPIAKNTSMIGKRLKSRLNFPIPKAKPVPKKEESDDKPEEEEEDKESDSEQMVTSSTSVTDTQPTPDEQSDKKPQKYGLILKPSDDNSPTETPSSVKLLPKTKSTVRPKDSTNSEQKKDTVSTEVHIDTDSTNITKDTVSKSDAEKSELEAPPQKIAKKNPPKKSKVEIDVYASESAEYSTWTPPVGQTGDGMTHLNAKYGY